MTDEIKEMLNFMDGYAERLRLAYERMKANAMACGVSREEIEKFEVKVDKYYTEPLKPTECKALIDESLVKRAKECLARPIKIFK